MRRGEDIDNIPRMEHGYLNRRMTSSLRCSRVCRLPVVSTTVTSVLEVLTETDMVLKAEGKTIIPRRRRMRRKNSRRVMVKRDEAGPGASRCRAAFLTVWVNHVGLEA